MNNIIDITNITDLNDDLNKIHNQANLLFQNEKYEFAINHYNLLLDSDYKLYIIYSNISACYLKLKNFKYALENALKSIQLNLNFSVAWGRVGFSYKGLKMFSESLKAFEIANKLNKKNIIYKNELIFLDNRFNKKINMNNIFKIILNNKHVYDKIKEIKKDVLNININNIESNKNIYDIINQILNKI